MKTTNAGGREEIYPSELLDFAAKSERAIARGVPGPLELLVPVSIAMSPDGLAERKIELVGQLTGDPLFQKALAPPEYRLRLCLLDASGRAFRYDSPERRTATDLLRLAQDAEASAGLAQTSIPAGWRLALCLLTGELNAGGVPVAEIAYRWGDAWRISWLLPLDPPDDQH